MATRSKVKLFEQIPKVHEREGLSKRELAERFKTHRRNVRQATAAIGAATRELRLPVVRTEASTFHAHIIETGTDSYRRRSTQVNRTRRKTA